MDMPTETDPMLTPPEVADRLAMSVKVLARWRERGEGPTYHRIGKSIRYRQSDLNAWLAGRRVAAP